MSDPGDRPTVVLNRYGRPMRRGPVRHGLNDQALRIDAVDLVEQTMDCGFRCRAF